MEKEDICLIKLPIELVEKLVKPWYLIKQWDAEKIREACRNSLEEKNEFTRSTS